MQLHTVLPHGLFTNTSTLLLVLLVHYHWNAITDTIKPDKFDTIILQVVMLIWLYILVSHGGE